jgi:hypothetical protein
LCKTWDNSEDLEGEKEREIRCLTVGGRGGGAGVDHVVRDASVGEETAVQCSGNGEVGGGFPPLAAPLFDRTGSGRWVAAVALNLVP